MPRSKGTRKVRHPKKPKLSLSQVLLQPLPASTEVLTPADAGPKHTPWPAFCAALGTEFRDATEIHGQSGLVHPIAGLGIDEKGKRLIVVSADHNPRVAALMRMDVQASLPEFRVLTARPLAVDLPSIVKRAFYDEEILSISKMLRFVDGFGEGKSPDLNKETFADNMQGFLNRMSRSDIPAKTHLHNLIEQLATADWPRLNLDGKISLFDIAAKTVDGFARIDNMSADRENGLCPVPTYEFSESDWEMLLSGQRIDDVAQRLRELEVYQYFFPSKDGLALGLIDRGATDTNELSSGLALAERDGHIISPNSILDNAADVKDIISEFRNSGIITEGEMSWELSEEGKTIRNTVKFRPSEGLITRLSKIVAFRVDISLNKLLGKE